MGADRGTASLGEVLDVLDTWYDPAWAESWDTVGLVLGDRGRPVRSVLFAVDPTPAVVDEAVGGGADLLVTHHPLWLGGTDRLDGSKGAICRRLLEAGCALHVAHTNADVAVNGVSDALAGALGLSEVRTLVPQLEALDRWVVHVPGTHTDRVLAAMSAAGAGVLGDYDRCSFVSGGTGSFRPLTGAAPYLGQEGVLERVAEDRIEMIGEPRRRDAIAAAVRAAHPYEEPSLTVVETRTPSMRGLGRIGVLPEPLRLSDFVRHVDTCLPATAAGVRATGDPDTLVRTVAVAGGATIDLAGAAHAGGAHAFVTSDSKHHRALEAPLPIVDVAHWAGEWPWVRAAADRLRAALPGASVAVSHLVTDPWTTTAGGSSYRVNTEPV